MDIEPLIQLLPGLADKPVTISPLTGGITNRNYRIDADGESYVLRIAGEQTELLGIDRSVEHACSLAAAQLNVGPEVIAFLPEHRVLVTRLVDGQVLTPDDAQRWPVLQRVVEALRRYHEGPAGPGSFSPFDTVRTYYNLARERGVAFPPDIGVALKLLDRIEEAVQTDEPVCPCHNDLLPANFIDNGHAIWIIDWEYGGMGDRFFDLGNLAANFQLEELQERTLLELYFGEVREDCLRRLRLMRCASDVRESLWGFLQSGISTLDVDFLNYGRTHLRRLLQAVSTLEGDIPAIRHL